MPLHYMEISEQILSRGYYVTDGATHAATVSAQLTSSIKHDGENSPFMRVGKGVFALKNMPAVPVGTKQKKLEALVESDVDSSDSVIRSFGMYFGSAILLYGEAII